MSKSEKRQIHDRLKQLFGIWAFDNEVLFCWGKNQSEFPGPLITENFNAGGNNHVVTFELDVEHPVTICTIILKTRRHF